MTLITVPIAKILSVKNARAWVSMVSYLKKKLVEMGWIGSAI